MITKFGDALFESAISHLSIEEITVLHSDLGRFLHNYKNITQQTMERERVVINMENLKYDPIKRP